MSLIDEIICNFTAVDTKKYFKYFKFLTSLFGRMAIQLSWILVREILGRAFQSSRKTLSVMESLWHSLKFIKTIIEISNNV
jgi:hypothetical protein